MVLKGLCFLRLVVHDSLKSIYQNFMDILCTNHRMRN